MLPKGKNIIWIQMDTELTAVHKVLLHKNFLRIMSAQVAIILQLLKECVDENPGVRNMYFWKRSISPYSNPSNDSIWVRWINFNFQLDPSFYRRLLEAVQVVTDFFHASGKGISMDVLETNPNHMVDTTWTTSQYSFISDAGQDSDHVPDSDWSIDREILQRTSPATSNHSFTVVVFQCIFRFFANFAVTHFTESALFPFHILCWLEVSNETISSPPSLRFSFL